MITVDHILRQIIKSCLLSMTLLYAICSHAVDLTPDVAAPMAPSQSRLPPSANNAPQDHAIEIAVQSVLAPTAVEVKVKALRGIVYLSGWVTTEDQFVDDVANSVAAYRVLGVNAEQLNIKYSTHAKQDLLLTGKLMGRLLNTNVLGKDMSTWTIHLESKQGQVFVTGTLPTTANKTQMISVIKCTPGVLQVHDQIQQ